MSMRRKQQDRLFWVSTQKASNSLRNIDDALWSFHGGSVCLSIWLFDGLTTFPECTYALLQWHQGKLRLRFSKALTPPPRTELIALERAHGLLLLCSVSYEGGVHRGRKIDSCKPSEISQSFVFLLEKNKLDREHVECLFTPPPCQLRCTPGPWRGESHSKIKVETYFSGQLTEIIIRLFILKPHQEVR